MRPTLEILIFKRMAISADHLHACRRGNCSPVGTMTSGTRRCMGVRRVSEGPAMNVVQILPGPVFFNCGVLIVTCDAKGSDMCWKHRGGAVRDSINAVTAVARDAGGPVPFQSRSVRAGKVLFQLTGCHGWIGYAGVIGMTSSANSYSCLWTRRAYKTA